MTDLNAIKTATQDLHSRAERSGIIAEILGARASRYGVALLLRNLLPVYEALDSSAVGHPALARSAAINADLRVLFPGVELALLPEATAYAGRIGRAAAGDGAGLLGHAYVRYLGDLNGGRIMHRCLVKCLGPVATTLSFGSYPALDDEQGFRHTYRMEIDRAVRAAGFKIVEREALAAFELNIDLSDAVQAHVTQHPR